MDRELIIENIKKDIKNISKNYANALISFLLDNANKLDKYSSISKTPQEFFESERDAYLIILNRHDDMHKKYNYIVSIYENLSRTANLGTIFEIDYITNKNYEINGYSILFNDNEVYEFKSIAVTTWINSIRYPMIRNNYISSIFIN